MPEDYRIKKKKKQQLLPSWILPAAAVGGLGTTAAYGIAGDKQTNLIRNQIERYNRPLEPEETVTTRYGDLMSAAASTSPFTVPVPQIIRAARTNKRLLELLKAPSTAHITNQTQAVDAAGHYNSYARGQIPAYYHELHHRIGNKEVSPDKLPKDVTNGKPVLYKDLVQPYFQSALNRYQANRFGPALEHSPNLEIAGIDLRSIPHHQQAEIMKEYSQSLPDWLKKLRPEYENGTREAGIKGYYDLTKKVVNLRDNAKTVGFASGGAAIGGALGHYLQSLFPQGKKKNRFADLARLAVTAGGAGLGGYAGYLAAKPTKSNQPPAQ